MTHLLNDIASWLGPWNPLHAPHPQSSQPAYCSTIWLLDATASLVDPSSTAETTSQNTPHASARSTHPSNTTITTPTTQKWNADLYAAYFAAHTSAKLKDLVEEVRKLLKLPADSKELKTAEERLRPFFLEVLEGRGTGVVLGDVEGNRGALGEGSRGVVRLGAKKGEEGKEEGGSDRNGISRDEVELVGNWVDGDVVVGRLAGREGDVEGKENARGGEGDVAETSCVEASVTLAGAEGWAVISDIDDTIKKTLTNSATGILTTTFISPPQPIRGMPAFYTHLLTTLSDPPFWYLSASPYNLYPFLHAFRSTHYPHGTMLLKTSSWQNIAGFLASLSQGVQEYKVGKMVEIHDKWPGRRMVLVGDSTQKDPESYGEVARRFPRWVGRIFVRRVRMVKEVTDIFPGQGDEERNKPERFEKAFEGLDKSLWYVFDEPEELYAQLDAAVKAHPN